VCSTYYLREILSVAKFLTLRPKSAAEIHHQLVETYGSEVTSSQHFYKWVRSFKEGRTGTQSEKLQHLSFGTKKGFCWLISWPRGPPSMLKHSKTKIKKKKIKDTSGGMLN
ncbi:hypothetical protein AAG570_005824, partial [Ranatra chinensis]